MKRFLFTILIVLTALPAAAQEPDTTSTVIGEKLDFDAPQVITETYFESVKAHLSKEGRKAWKPEFSMRGNVMIYVGSIDVTIGVRTSPNKVFGLCAGWSSVFIDAIPANAYGMHLCLYHRHYIPLDRKRRISLYSDLLGGRSYTYDTSYPHTGQSYNNGPKKGDWQWWCSWQPGISIRLVNKSNIFFGPTIGPSIGVHAGIAL